MVAALCQRCEWQGPVETVANAPIFNCPECGGGIYRIVTSSNRQGQA